MKKLLLSALLSVLFIGGALAQFRYGTYPIIGMVSSTLNSNDQDTLLVNYNTNTAISTYTASAVTLSKCQTQRGMQCFVYSDNTTTTSVQSGNFKGNHYETNGNPVHVASLESLFEIMTKSSTLPLPTNGNAADTLTNPAHCLFDNGSTTDQAFGVYPGKYKHVEYGYYFDLAGKTLTDDITFDIDTYNIGTTGKTASYELTVYASTSKISTFSPIGSTTNDGTNLMGRVANFYVTGSGKQTVNLSTVLGKTLADFTNKKLYIFLKTLGTKNSSDVLDGLPNDANFTTHVPVVYDPTIVFDNFKIYYSIPIWSVPTGATQNAYLNHNNGTVAVGGSADFTGGTPVSIYPNTENTIKFYLTDLKRASALTITEGNDGGVTNPKYTFAATGAVKAKSGLLGFVTDVTYSFVPTDGTSKFKLTIPAPVSGLVTDTLEISINVSNVSSGLSSNERLEIDNGVRFYYTIGAKADLSTSLNPNSAEETNIWTLNSYLFVGNAQSSVKVYTVSGQKIKEASVVEATKGIKLNAGAYIVRSGSEVRKVFVK